MASAVLSANAKSEIQQILDSVTTRSETVGVPGLVFTAVDKSGHVLTHQCSGKRGIGLSAVSQAPMTPETIFAIYSCTKMITGIAAMQLVEQGKILLDDPQFLYKVAPELEAKQVLQMDGTFVPRQGDITVRSLLTHTAGFGYSFFDPRIRNAFLPAGVNEFSGDIEDIVSQPLVNQPGSMWEYSISLDWVGIVVERVSGMKLDAYFKKFIFEPLAITDMTFHPSPSMLQHLAVQQQRIGDKTIERGVLLRRAVTLSATEEQQAKIFNSGGAGCFGTPSSYCKILATFLNDGTSPETGKTILSQSTVDEMFTNQIPQFPNFARQEGEPVTADPILANAAPELYPQEGNPPQGWGLTFFITIAPGATGRGPNTAWWAGISNLFWWCDREKGVAGMIAAQILPFGDPAVLSTWFACEKAVYDALAAGEVQ